MIEMEQLTMPINMYPVQTIHAEIILNVVLALSGEVKLVVIVVMVEIVQTSLVNA